jgi:WD40 repeat protein
MLESIYVAHQVSRILVLNNHSFAIGGTIDNHKALISIWNFKTKAQLLSLFGHSSEGVWALAKLKDELLSSGGNDGVVKFWNYANGQLQKNLTGHIKRITDLVAVRNNSLISCSIDKTIRIWNATSGIFLNQLPGHHSPIMCIHLASSDLLLSGSEDRTIRFWNLTTRQNKKVLDNEQVKISDNLLVLDNHGWLASGGPDFVIQIWNIEKEFLVYELAGHTDIVFSLVGLKKGHMASGSFDMSIKIWNYENPEFVTLLTTLVGHEQSIYSLRLLPDGILASGAWDLTVKLWNLTAIYSYPNRSILIPVDF